MTKEECREQIQEDIIAYAAISTVPTKEADALCQIVVDNFKKLEACDHQSLLAELEK